MPVSETWKKISLEATLKGYPIAYPQMYVGLGLSGFTLHGDDMANGEVIGIGYQRQLAQWTDFGADMRNADDLFFNVGGVWGSLAAIFISPSAQGGKVLIWDTFFPQITSLTAGDQVKISAGGIVLT